MQGLLRLARRTSLLHPRPILQQQGIITRASSASQSEEPGIENNVTTDGAAEEIAQQVQEPAVTTPFRIEGFSAVTSSRPANPTTSEKVYGRLSNCPKYAFKTDILAYFEACNLQPHQVVTIYDEKYRQRFIQLEFDNMDQFRLAQRTIVRQGRLGGRYMKLDKESKRHDDDDIHNVVKAFRGQSLLMMQVPNEATGEDLERFFQGYNLAAYATRILRVPKDFPPTFNSRKAAANPKDPAANFEKRALVKFASPLEAARALRAKHGQFCLNKAVDLRFVQ